ncbi:hypothetical protein [Candidatus Magnetobacterium casense]|uniref:Uncharacterized protein n=1 Tax=Candidatus Magnetobacterium casense TaxID=1455061 RepID=A0ABS6RY28_9BACT|nr:hypothetical protein [Candidatus Magnetobacterium casensis]MBV6341486.1 hypothetical protein [Candidatus Magnetobacterium casensis]
MSELGFQIALTAFLSLIVSSIDLFRDYKEETLNKAWIWVLFYLALNIGASVFVFVVSLNADVTISMSKNRISLSEINEWVKSVFCGMFLLFILKSRLFMIKIGKSNDVINPEYRFQQIVNIIKLKIAERGLSGNLEKMQRLLVSLSVDELINGANLIIRVDELWQYSDKKSNLQ